MMDPICPLTDWKGKEQYNRTISGYNKNLIKITGKTPLIGRRERSCKCLSSNWIFSLLKSFLFRLLYLLSCVSLALPSLDFIAGDLDVGGPW